MAGQHSTAQYNKVQLVIPRAFPPQYIMKLPKRNRVNRPKHCAKDAILFLSLVRLFLVTH